MSSAPISSRSFANNLFTALATPACAPFGAEDDGAVAATAPEGSYTYAIVPSAPSVESSEVESSAQALEITVKWGESVLHVAHLSPVRDFTVGESACDFTMSSDKLGAECVKLIAVDVSGKVSINVATNATARLLKKGQSALVVAGGESVELESEARATLELGGLTFEIASVKAGKKVAGARSINKRALGFGALAAAVHGGLFAAMFAFTPALNATDDGSMSSDQQLTISQQLQAMAEKEQNEKQAADQEAAKSSEAGSDGQRAKDAEGKLGTETAKADNAHFTVKDTGPNKSLAAPQSRQEALQVAEGFGMISILNQMNDPNAVTAPWGDIASGNDKQNFNGAMWGDKPGDSFGPGGLGLSGEGRGGGGRGELLGLGDIGTIGHGHGSCASGPCMGDGNGNFLAGTHRSRAPRLPPTDSVKVGGRLPAEVIQRVIRQNFGRFRGCYEFGLRSNPNLQGRVVVSFVIGVDGSVGSASNGGSDLPDPSVVSCIVRSFGGMSFPEPDGGVVSVTYPISLTPTN
jgi:hypothetical protein